MAEPMSAPMAETGHTEIRDALLDMLVEASNGAFARDEIDPAANLFDYGYIDSLSGVAFLADVEYRFGVELDDFEVIERLDTLDALTERLAGGAG